MNMQRLGMVMCLIWMVSAVVAAADWPEWRGPQRNGVVDKSPPLATTWPEAGPKSVWVSEEEILSGSIGGYSGGGWGSVSVADGRAYCSFVAPRPEKIATRTLTEQRLIGLGWTAKKPPAELLESAEAARLSPERQELKDNAAIQAWALKWLKANLSVEQQKECGTFILGRVKQGKDAIEVPVLDRLATIKDKPFPSQEALDTWLTENKIEGALRKRVQSLIPTTETYRDTVVLCMDAATGKTVWKKVFPSGLFLPLYENAAASGTPCVANSKVYLLGTNVEAFCLDAKTGEKVWSARIGSGKQRDGHCSFIVADGVAAVSGPPLVGFDADTGKELWSHEIKEGWASPVFWRKDGKTYFVVRAGGTVLCVDPKPGTILWSMKDITTDGLFYGMTPVVQDDHMVLAGKGNIRLYKLSLEKAEELWKVDCPTDNCCSPTIYDGHIYVFAGSFGATCVNIQSGKVAWQDKELKTGSYHSPLIADGKFFIQGHDKKAKGYWGDGSLCMIAVSPEKGQILGQAKIGQVLCASAAMADGRIFCRLNKRIACYDLRE